MVTQSFLSRCRENLCPSALADPHADLFAKSDSVRGAAEVACKAGFVLKDKDGLVKKKTKLRCSIVGGICHLGWRVMVNGSDAGEGGGEVPRCLPGCVKGAEADDCKDTEVCVENRCATKTCPKPDWPNADFKGNCSKQKKR